MGWEVRERFKNVDVWQKPTQYCKVIIFQFKIKLKKIKTYSYVKFKNKIKFKINK